MVIQENKCEVRSKVLNDLLTEPFIKKVSVFNSINLKMEEFEHLTNNRTTQRWR